MTGNIPGYGPYLIDVGERLGRELPDYIQSDEYVDQFVGKIGELYDSQEKWEAESARCFEASSSYSISKCAEQLYERM